MMPVPLSCSFDMVPSGGLDNSSRVAFPQSSRGGRGRFKASTAAPTASGRRVGTIQSAQTTLIIAYEIPWGTNGIHATQVTMVIAHDLSPLSPGEGSATITMLCQIIR